MKVILIRLRSAAIAASLALPAAANAQNAQNTQMAGDQLSQLFARTEAKHRSSRRNLTEILRSQPRFWIELRAVAERLQTQPAWLLNVMASESLFNPAARNGFPGQTASGLLQFIEATARRMGTTTEAIRRMNPVEQLRLVERYLTPFRGRLNSLADVYLAVFRGVVIEGGDTVVVVDSSKERRIYALNKSLDLNGDGRSDFVGWRPLGQELLPLAVAEVPSGNEARVALPGFRGGVEPDALTSRRDREQV